MSKSQTKKCDYGCGQEARYQFKNGKLCCSENHSSCPAVNDNRKSEKCPYCDKKLNSGNLPKHVETCPHNPQNKTYCKECGALLTGQYQQEFCSNSCAASYNNKHNKTGITRSKLEEWIEEQLESDFSNLDIRFNDTETLNGLELDIFFPELRFAVEINGIIHYEPIYGEDTFEEIESRDKQKQYICNQAGIELFVIDTSGQEKFSPETSRKYYKLIKERINKIKNRANVVEAAGN